MENLRDLSKTLKKSFKKFSENIFFLFKIDGKNYKKFGIFVERVGTKLKRI